MTIIFAILDNVYNTEPAILQTRPKKGTKVNYP